MSLSILEKKKLFDGSYCLIEFQQRGRECNQKNKTCEDNKKQTQDPHKFVCGCELTIYDDEEFIFCFIAILDKCIIHRVFFKAIPNAMLSAKLHT